MLLTVDVVESLIVSPAEHLTRDPASGWWVLLAYKGGAAAKSRLAAQLAGLSQTRRSDQTRSMDHRSLAGIPLSSRLAEAMARDTVQAIVDSGAAQSLTIVCGSDEAAQQARSWFSQSLPVDASGERPGIRVQALPQPDNVRGLNAALSWARGSQGPHHGAVRVAAVLGDVPALRAEDVVAALRGAQQEFARGADQVFVPDAHGQGTVLLAARLPHLFFPKFGPDSAQAHERVGAVRFDLPRPTLRTDVDSLADLRAVSGLGAGTHTTAVLRSEAVEARARIS